MGKTTNILIAVAAGLAAGLTIGFLLAPDKGVKTRKRLRLALDDLQGNLGEEISDRINTLREAFQKEVEKAGKSSPETDTPSPTS